MKIKEKQRWKPFFNLLIQAKLPWIRYIVFIVGSLVASNSMVEYQMLAGQIMGGNLSDSSVVTKFLLYAVMFGMVNVLVLVFARWISMIVYRNLQDLTWDKIIRLPIPYFDKYNPSTLISRITIDSKIVSNMVYLLGITFSSIYMAFKMFIEAYSMNSNLAIAIYVGLPIMILFLVIIGRLSHTAQNRIQGEYSVLTAFLAERLPNMKLIKSSSTEEKEKNTGEVATKKQYKAEMSLARVDLLINILYAFIYVYCSGVVLVYGAKLMANNSIDLGQLITFFMFSQMLSGLAVTIFRGFQSLKKAQGAVNKTIEILESESEKLDRERSFAIPNDDIKLKNVNFAYNTDTVLSNFDIVIPKGKTTAIIGPSGAGKTTIIKLIERFYLPSSGQIEFGDIPVEEIHLDEWREAIGYVSQNSPLMKGTIRDNIVYGMHRDVTDEEVIHAAKLANAYDFIMECPEGFATDVGEQGSKLSGGQRQRIAIARSIIKDPDYLILDEATGSLDAWNQYEVQKALSNLMKGRTTIIVAHSIKMIKEADKIIVLDEGQVKGEGNHDELYKDNSLYRNYYDLQFTSQ